MTRKAVLGIMLTFLFLSMLALALNIQPVKSDWTWTETIYIRADGSVDPPTAPISTVDNTTYTFTDNIVGAGTHAIVVQKDNIVVDGAGHTLQGSGYGISLTGRSNVTIKNMEITAFNCGIWLAYSSSNSISGNNITRNDLGIQLLYSSGNSISGNNVARNNVRAIGLWHSSSYNSISGNNVTHNERGIGILYSQNNNVSGNYISGNRRRGIALKYSSTCYNIISGNKITGNGDGESNSFCGIYLAFNSSNNIISGNDITGNNRHGIGLWSNSSHNSLSGNNITGNAVHGIQIASSNNIISGNNITGNGSGIALLYSSNYNIFSGNNITGNDEGISLSNSFNNIFSGNNITGNDEGIRLRHSSNNTIYHNNFVYNAEQVYSYNSTNVWDDGYPSGGNYWNDYFGNDTYSGPYQNETGSDGIGDTPYVIDENNRDTYPFMDITSPTTIDDSDELWHTADFMVTLIARDDRSGVEATYYRINEGPVQNVGTHGQPRITTQSANNTLEYWSVDKAGNEEAHHILTGIKLDRTVPIGSIKINNDAVYAPSTSVTLTLTAIDPTSGVYQVRFSNDGIWDTEPWETSSATKVWTLPSGDGTKTVYYQIKDNAGLVSTYSDIITLDATKPNANAGNDQTVNVGAAVTFDASNSTDNVGIITYYWNFGDVHFGHGRWTTHTYENPGKYTVTLTVTDPAGNTDTHSITITVEEAFPMLVVGAVAAIAAAAAAIGTAVAAKFLWKKRK